MNAPNPHSNNLERAPFELAHLIRWLPADFAPGHVMSSDFQGAIDQKIGIRGLPEGLVLVGWIVDDAEGVSLTTQEDHKRSILRQFFNDGLGNAFDRPKNIATYGSAIASARMRSAWPPNVSAAPTRPRSDTRTLAPDSSDGEKVLALARDVPVHLKYEAQLRP